MFQVDSSVVQRLADEYLIFKCITGSRSYGLSGPHSDTDYQGVFIAPPECRIGLQRVEQHTGKEPDIAIYELAKFIRLAAACNPNIIELLFTDSIEFIDPAFQKVRDQRHLFLSKVARHTFSGYAFAQLKRIRGHRKWLTQPQTEQPPNLLEFAKWITPFGDFVEKISLDSGHFGAFSITFRDCFLVKVNATTFRIFYSPEFNRPMLSTDGMNIQCIKILGEQLKDSQFLGTLIVQVDEFKKQHKLWKNYWEWKRHRNPARAALEKEHGFDCKHAMHLIRLLRMAKEILEQGKVIINRPDAEELLAIRNGSISYEELMDEADRTDEELDDLYKKSVLPEEPNYEEINRLLVDVTTEFWRRRDLSP